MTGILKFDVPPTRPKLPETRNGFEITPPASEQRTATAILTKAAELVGGDRAKQHGPKVKNHQNIADHWNAYLGDRLKTPITALDVALMMLELKIARTKAGAYNPDDYNDMAGYSGCAGEIAAVMSWKNSAE
jgi:hypothetical protein